MENISLKEQTEYAEEQIIGSVIIDPDSFSLIKGKLKVEHFATDKYREIYQAMLLCDHADIISVGWKLHETGKLQKDTRSILLMAMADTVTSLDIEYYAGVVIKYAAQRYIDYYNHRNQPDKAKRIIDKVFGGKVKGGIQIKPTDPLQYPERTCSKCGGDSWGVTPDLSGYYCTNCVSEGEIYKRYLDYMA